MGGKLPASGDEEMDLEGHRIGGKNP